MLTHWPSADQRQRLAARHRALVAHVAKNDKARVVTAVVALMGCYPNARKAGDDVQKIAAKYAAELRDVPTWAIERTCAAIRNNEYPEHATYPPSTIAIKGLAEGYVKTVREEASRIFEILHAEKLPEPVSEAERQRIGGGMRQLADHLRGLPDTLADAGRARTEELAAKREAVLARRRQPADAAE